MQNPPDKLEEADRLSVENLFLKMQLLQQKVESLDMQKLKCVEEMRGIQEQVAAKRAALSQKYGVPIDPVHVLADGTIVRKPATPVMVRQERV